MPACAEAQSTEDLRHRATNEGLSDEVPAVSMDCTELIEHGDEMRRVTVIVYRDQWIKASVAHVIKAKCIVELAKGIVEFRDSFGYTVVVLKSDD